MYKTHHHFSTVFIAVFFLVVVGLVLNITIVADGYVLATLTRDIGHQLSIFACSVKRGDDAVQTNQ